MKFYNKFNHLTNFYFILHYSSVLLIIMSSPGQKKGTCGHIMALFDGHLKCARCRDKGIGDDLCVVKRDCPICKAFAPEQILQLATPTNRERKNKKVSASPTPTLLDHSQISVLGWVDGEKKSETPADKKKRTDNCAKPSSKKSKLTTTCYGESR